MNSIKNTAIFVITALILCVFCACGGSTDDMATNTSAETATKATVTAGEAAEQAAQDKADNEGPIEPTTHKKTGTEDPALEAAKAAAYEDLKGFDGKWKNIEVDVDDTITIIDFDWNGSHYEYTFNQETGEIVR